MVPKGRRARVVQTAHTGMAGGHFTGALINRCFTWPGISKDVGEWCESCSTCQMTQKVPERKAPLIPMPIVLKPRSILACDLVGPLPRSAKGNYYY